MKKETNVLRTALEFLAIEAAFFIGLYLFFVI